MNRMLAPLRGTAAAITLTLASTGAAVYGAPKKSPPATVVQSAPEVSPAAPKKGIFSKAKDLLTFKKKEQPAAEVPPQKTAPVKTAKAVPVAKAKTKAKSTDAPASTQAPASAAKKTPAPVKSKAGKDGKVLPAEQPVVQADPPKKGWFKGLFSKSKEEVPAPPAGPQLANAKTAKPAPVKEVKSPAKPETLAAGIEPEPKEKRGFLGFFRKLREPIPDSPEFTVADAGKIERPADWQEHKVVSESRTAIYSFGPTQANGPDRRLESGTVVKVKSVRRGWALVEVEGGFAGYMDASALRDAAKGDFKDPPPPTMVASTATPDYWAPLAPPPDLPDQPSKGDSESALLLLPPLELEPKPNP